MHHNVSMSPIPISLTFSTDCVLLDAGHEGIMRICTLAARNEIGTLETVFSSPSFSGYDGVPTPE
jgi:hypothetical protein